MSASASASTPPEPMRTAANEGVNVGSPLGLAASDAAQLIGVSLSHFYQLHKTGRLPLPIRLGRSVRWIRSELVEWLETGAPSRSRWEALKGRRR